MSVGDKIRVVRNFIGGSCWSMVYFMRPIFLRLQTPVGENILLGCLRSMEKRH